MKVGRIRGLVVSGLIIVVLAWYAGCGRRDDVGRSSDERHTENEGGRGMHSGRDAVVRIGREAQKRMGMEIVEVGYRKIEKRVTVPGEIARDTDRIQHVLPPIPGRIIEKKVELGTIVNKGDAVAIIRSGEGGRTIVISAPSNGMVIAENIKIGHEVDSLQSLYTIADLTKLWATFDVYEKDIGMIRRGQPIKVRTVAYPDRVFDGSVTFISPRVDEKTRTIKVRGEINNPNYLLKLGMYVTGNILTDIKENVIAVPVASIQRLGADPVVFLREGPEEFRPRLVTIGGNFDGWAEITSGLERGEEVVSSGSFYLKAEMQKETFAGGHGH